MAGTGRRAWSCGDAVNVAARLEQAARPGEILLGETTYRLVRDAIVAEPVEPLDLKGKTRPGLRVPPDRGRPPRAAGFARRLDAPMVGRERELALLRSAFDRTVTDQACQLFTVLGVGGVGKSRLIEAFVDALGDRATVLRGRCLPYGDGITFFPLVEAVIEIADLQAADAPEAARDEARGARRGRPGRRRGRIAEQVGQAIGIAAARARRRRRSGRSGRCSRASRRERPARVRRSTTSSGPSRRCCELVEHVADFARDAPILLACMARPELLDDAPGWAGGKLNATSILVEPLGREECGTLVANLLADDDVGRGRPGADRGRGRGTSAVRRGDARACSSTRDVLVLNEDRWVATGDLSDVPVPPTISALLAARLDRLPRR